MKPQTYESWIIEHGITGTHFFTDKSCGHMGAIASQKKRTIKTERLIAISNNFTDPHAAPLTKVTVL
jgi:hypothetical protein